MFDSVRQSQHPASLFNIQRGRWELSTRQPCRKMVSGGECPASCCWHGLVSRSGWSEHKWKQGWGKCCGCYASGEACKESAGSGGGSFQPGLQKGVPVPAGVLLVAFISSLMYCVTRRTGCAVNALQHLLQPSQRPSHVLWSHMHTRVPIIMLAGMNAMGALATDIQGSTAAQCARSFLPTSMEISGFIAKTP